jgi:hypothetical protein
VSDTAFFADPIFEPRQNKNILATEAEPWARNLIQFSHELNFRAPNPKFADTAKIRKIQPAKFANAEN